jgi:hypothetical protein
MVDKVTKHVKSISDWLREYAEVRKNSELDYLYIQDNQSKNYQVVRTGWDNYHFMYLVVFHFQIKNDGKVWVWANHTDIDLAQVFRQLSIDNTDIVPAFQPVSLRRYAGFAEA